MSMTKDHFSHAPSKHHNTAITELWQNFNEILEESGASTEGENTVIRKQCCHCCGPILI